MSDALAVDPLLPPGLVFGLDDTPGITRAGERRFRYIDRATGQRITDEATLARITALAVPPAWTDVWISTDPHGHLQATGRDAKGRKQYRYHTDFRAHREEAKFEQLLPFGRALPALRRQLQRDLARRGLPAEKVTALVINLLERTYVRVGNEEYARTNGSFGLTTLRNRHVHAEGGNLRIRFTAKSAKSHVVVIDDPRLVRLIRRCQELPGQILFQYVDADGATHPVRSSEVNDYLRAVTGGDHTAKTFRTWGATLMATVGLGALPPPTSNREGRHVVTDLLAAVAGALNNTPAVCRRSYVHPYVVESYLDGTLGKKWAATSARGSNSMSRDERRLVDLLDRVGGPS